MGAVLDLFNVLLEPTAVFERVREKPKFLAPFLVICALQMIIGFLNLPFTQAAMHAMAASRPAAPAGAADPAKFAAIGLLFVPVGLIIAYVISAGLLWILTSLMSGEAKFIPLLSVTTYASITGVLLATAGVVVLRLKGIDNVTSMADLQPALGLDLLVPEAGKFLASVLKAINPFTIWGLILTAIGVTVTHKTSKGTGYTVATVSFLIGVLVAGGLASLFGGRAG
ncbi:MAG: hypothetical protein DMD41_05235 [Gemmatimonadetes bacterium]|nr:MAG: hypothetical protein DMD41_05235 [Gemmatimonadota bacterium]